jgi:hypothetical protein
MQDEQPEWEEHGEPGFRGDVVPITNPILKRVIDVGKVIRLQNPGNPVKMDCIHRPDGVHNMVTYTLPDNKGGVEFMIYGPGVIWEHLVVTVWPIPLFQEKVLPGELLFSGMMKSDGFLDPPTNIIPFDLMEISTRRPDRSIHTIRFELTGNDNIDAGVRLLLTKFAFAH